jgi:hypothetical protein
LARRLPFAEHGRTVDNAIAWSMNAREVSACSTWTDVLDCSARRSVSVSAMEARFSANASASPRLDVEDVHPFGAVPVHRPQWSLFDEEGQAQG